MNEKFKTAIQSYPESIQSLAFSSRELIFSILPQVVEVVWEKQKTAGYGTGPKKNSEHFCWIMPTKNHVNIGFNYGSELPDHGNILEGTGKLYRHFKVKNVDDLDNKHLIDLIKFSTSYKVPNLTDNNI